MINPKENINIIAIDGPSGAGKSTIAKEIAKSLKIEYIDTGAMYRCVAYKCIKMGISPNDEKEIENLLDAISIDISSGEIYLDGKIVKDEIRSEDIGKGASEFSKLQIVRDKMIALQRKIGENRSVVMDGRDIGTNVFPNASHKFYIDATSEERAKRRHAELIKKGENVTYEKVLIQINDRDYKDRTRELNPLKIADDAIVIDTTSLSIEEACNIIKSTIKK